MTSGDVFIWVSLDSKRMRLWLETSHWRGSAPSQSQFHLMSVTVGVKHSSNGCVKNGATTCWWNWNRRKRSKSDTVWSFTWNIFLYKYSCTHFFCCCCCCCCCWWCCSLLPLDLMYIFFPPWRCSLVIPIRMNSIQIKFEVLDRVSLSLSTVQVQTVLDSIIHPPQFQLKRFNRIIPRSGFCFHSHWFHPPNGWLLIQLIRIIHPKIIWCGHTEGLERKRRRKKRRKREKRRVKEGGRWRVCVCVCVCIDRNRILSSCFAELDW